MMMREDFKNTAQTSLQVENKFYEIENLCEV